MGIMPVLADAQAIAIATGRKPATIRSWAHRGHLKPRGKDPRGRTLYDLTEATNLASQRPLANHPHRVQH